MQNENNVQFDLQQTIVEWPPIRLMGISCRTSNVAEMQPTTNKISSTIEAYHTLTSNFNKQQPLSRFYHVYTAYESDFNGEYTFFIGQEIPMADTDTMPAHFKLLTIPAQKYIQFTAGPGNRLQVCMDLWQKIWNMQPAELGSERAYIADMEVYDERSTDPENSVLDILIGIK